MAQTSDVPAQQKPKEKQNSIRTTRQRAQAAFKKAREKFEETKLEVEDYIRKKPLKAAAIAAGIGMAIGFIIGAGIRRSPKPARYVLTFDKY